MAYAAANSTSPNPPVCLSAFIGSTAGAGIRQWYYRSTHTQTESHAAGFFTDGQNLGMALGDPVLVIGTTTLTISSHMVNAVGSTGAVSLSTGALYSS